MNVNVQPKNLDELIRHDKDFIAKGSDGKEAVILKSAIGSNLLLSFPTARVFFVLTSNTHLSSSCTTLFIAPIKYSSPSIAKCKVVAMFDVAIVNGCHMCMSSCHVIRSSSQWMRSESVCRSTCWFSVARRRKSLARHRKCDTPPRQWT